MTNDHTIVERDGRGIFFILMGLLPCFCTFVAIRQIYQGITSQLALNNGFWISIVVLMLFAPLTFYYFAFGLRKRKIFEINDLGILISPSKLIKWVDILEIEMNDYPGPRMRFYTINIITDYFKKDNTKIIFSSDIKPGWDEINEALTNYTVHYNINMT